MKKILSLFTLLFAFFGMTWAQESTEAFKLSDAPTESGWAKNTTWYYMKINGTKWISTDAAYCDNQGNIKLMNTQMPTNEKGMWCFVKNEDGTYTIYNKSDLTKVLGFVPTSNANNNGSGDRAKLLEPTAQNVSLKFEFKKENATSGYFAFRSIPSKLHIVEDRGDGAGTNWLASWNKSTEISGTPARKFEFIEAEAKRNLLKEKINEAETQWLPYEGEGVGKFSAAGQTNTLEKLLVYAENLYQETGTDAEYEATINEINTTIAAMTINQPIAGHFYAIKGKVNGKYADGTTNQDKAKTTDKVDGAFKAGHLFYLTNDKKLLNYAAGYYMVDTRAVKAGQGNTWTFHASKGNVKENGIAYYTLQSNFTGGGQYLYDNRSGSNTFCDRNSKYAQNNCDWAIEEVTTLPVNVSAAGWATLYAPVALTIPATEGLTVYTAAVEGQTLKLTALNGEIPANTPVLIEAAEGKYDFNINYNAAAAETATKGLKGTIETISKPTTTIYTLQKPDNKTIGFYKYNGETLQGFRAYGEDLLGTTSTAEGLTFEKGDVTAIENVEINDGKQTVIYDLNGRRVEKMLKGIYIVNGKKVIK